MGNCLHSYVHCFIKNYSALKKLGKFYFLEVYSSPYLRNVQKEVFTSKDSYKLAQLCGSFGMHCILMWSRVKGCGLSYAALLLELNSSS